jgi:hypothetical protein
VACRIRFSARHATQRPTVRRPKSYSRDGSLSPDLWDNLRDSQVTPPSAESCSGGVPHFECPGSKEVGQWSPVLRHI